MAKSMPFSLSISSTRIQWICGSRLWLFSSTQRRRSDGSRRSARGRARSRTRRPAWRASVARPITTPCRSARVLLALEVREDLAPARPSRARGSACGRSDVCVSRAGPAAGGRCGGSPRRRTGTSRRVKPSAAHRRPTSPPAFGGGGSGSIGLNRVRARRVAVHAEQVGLLGHSQWPRARPWTPGAPVAVLVAVALPAEPVRLGRSR